MTDQPTLQEYVARHELRLPLPYRGPHQRDHLRSVRLWSKAYRWEDPGTGQLRLVPDPEGQARIDRAVAAATRIWSPR